MFRRVISALLCSSSSLSSLCSLALGCGEPSGAPDELSAACQRQAECSGRAYTAQVDGECRATLLAEYDEASTYGCATPHADWVSCLATTRGQCPPFDPSAAPGPAATDPCLDQWQTFQRCRDGAGQDD